jgi:hypothetical protein
MMKPVCVPCQRFFRMIKSGVYFTEGMPTDNQAEPGTADPDKWTPYKLWSGDRWRCNGCGAEIISGVGHSAIAEHYQDGFSDLRKQLNADYQVNDC